MRNLTRTVKVLLLVCLLSSIGNVLANNMSVGAPLVGIWMQDCNYSDAYINNYGGNSFPTSTDYYKNYSASFGYSTNKLFRSTMVTSPAYHSETVVTDKDYTGQTPTRIIKVTNTLTQQSTSTTNTISSFPLTTRFCRGYSAYTNTLPSQNFRSVQKLSENCLAYLPYQGGVSGCTYWYRLYFSVRECIVDEWSDLTGSITDIGLVPAASIRMGEYGQYPVYDSVLPATGPYYVLLPLGGTQSKQYMDITPKTSVPLITWGYGDVVFDHMSQDNTPPEQ